jgi:hypothetical protein
VPDLEVTSAPPTKIEDMAYETKEIAVRGARMRFRELTVEENDAAADAAKQPDGTINGRTMMRMMIIASSVEPKLTPEQLGKLPQRVYLKIYDAVTELNTVELGDDPEEEGKN